MAANTIDPDHQMTPEFELPGFRFHPTEEELLEFYLKSMVFGKRLRFDIIGFLNIYHHDPWDLPGLSKIGEREWYFFVPRDRKHGSGGRPNRTTETGFWKATGSDRKIVSLSNPKRIIGLRKTLVFYKGRAPRGSKTDWVMNEYRLPDNCQYLKDIVLCKIYRKATSLKVLEQMAAIEGDQIKNFHASPNSSPPPTSMVKNLHASPNSSPPPTSMDTISFCSQALQEDLTPQISTNHVVFKQEIEDAALVIAQEQKDENAMEIKGSPPPPPPPPPPMYNLPELQVPKFSMDWTQDTVWTQMNSPWLQNLTPLANILNF